jgi:hypothetical protein
MKNKTEQIKAEVENICKNNPLNPHSSNYKMRMAKWQEKRLEELGLLEHMPNAPFRAGFIGHSDAKAVIEAAEDNGKEDGGFDANGEGWSTKSAASKLWQLLNESDEENEEEITTLTLSKGEKEQILEALHTRAEMQYGMKEHHLDMIYNGAIEYDYETGKADYTKAKEAAKNETQLGELGDKYFAEGYRLRETSRGWIVSPSDIEDVYIICRKIFAGHIAYSQAYRYQYVVKL